MNPDPRAVGLGMCVAGIVLWVIAVAIDAPTVSVVLSILIVMGGGLMLARADSGR